MAITAITPVEERDWTRIDRLIIASYGKKTARQLSQETGLSAEELMQRKQELVDSIDEITVQMQIQSLIGDLQDVAEFAKDAAKSSADEFKAGLLNARVAAIKLLLAQLEKLQRNSNVAVESLNALRLKEIMRLVDATIFKGVEQIAQTYGIDEDELLTVFKETLQIEAEKMDNL